LCGSVGDFHWLCLWGIGNIGCFVELGLFIFLMNQRAPAYRAN
jgi:hypothetical protein